jgi:PAS domain S-box-containing protein
MLLLLLLWRQQQQLHRLDMLAQQSKANRLLATLADNSSDAIFVKNLEGRYDLINREAARVAGKTAAQLLGRDDTALFPASQAELVRANDRRVMAEGRIQSYEEPLSTVDGERLFLATKGPLRADDGTLLGLFGISRDITERHHADLALKEQSRVLSERNQELERFNRVAVARELDMITLKRQVNELSRRFGLAPPYSLDFVPARADEAPSATARHVPEPDSPGHA